MQLSKSKEGAVSKAMEYLNNDTIVNLSGVSGVGKSLCVEKIAEKLRKSAVIICPDSISDISPENSSGSLFCVEVGMEVSQEIMSIIGNILRRFYNFV